MTLKTPELGMHAEDLEARDQPQSEGAFERASDFEALYARHAPFVWRTLRGLGLSAAEVEDAAQDVFLTAYRRLHTFEGRSSVRTWLCGITIGVARNLTRKARRHTQADASLSQAAETTPADTTEAMDLVARCLADLDEPLRLVFMFAELERFTAPEIAETLMVNVNTVYTRLRAARARFEESLARHGGVTP